MCMLLNHMLLKPLDEAPDYHWNIVILDFNLLLILVYTLVIAGKQTHTKNICFNQ